MTENSHNGFRWNVPNLLSLFRIAAAPVLLYLAFHSYETAFKWLLTAAFFTDMIDGWLARKLHQVTRWGSILDSVGDSLTILSGTAGLIYFRTDLFESHRSIFFVVVGLHAIQFCCAMIRYGKPSSFHTWSAKIAAFGIGIFLLATFHFGFYSPIFYLSMGLLILDAVEETILVFILPRWKNDVKGIFHVLAEKKPPAD